MQHSASRNFRYFETTVFAGRKLFKIQNFLTHDHFYNNVGLEHTQVHVYILSLLLLIPTCLAVGVGAYRGIRPRNVHPHALVIHAGQDDQPRHDVVFYESDLFWLFGSRGGTGEH